MLKHNLLLFYRSSVKHKSTFLINLIGLSTGLACTLIIYLWVHDELSVDKFHQKDKQLYQVMQNVPDGEGGTLTIEGTPGPLGKAILDEIPQVEEVAVVDGGDNGIVSVSNTGLKATHLFVPKNFFNVFSYQLIRGNKDDVLKEKSSILLSDEFALKLFHTNDIVGKTIYWDKGEYTGSYIVSGVFKKPSRNSSAQFDILLNYQVYFQKKATDLQDWGSSNPRTYLIIKKGTDASLLSDKISGFLKTKFKQAKGRDPKYVGTLFLQRYSDKYLYNHYENGVATGGRIAYVRLFSIIALFILAIACINFMNLSTAQVSGRLKEIGVKKAIGAKRKALIFQFLGESILMALLSLTTSLFLVALLLPQFNKITGKEIIFNFDINVLLSILTITLLTGLLSGSYPALYLSHFKPVSVLKGKPGASTGEAWVRRGLVVFQFGISIILIVSVLVIYKQVNFIHSKNLGYNKENILSFKREGLLNESLEAFMQELKKTPEVVNASTMGGNMTGGHGGTFGLDCGKERIVMKILILGFCMSTII